MDRSRPAPGKGGAEGRQRDPASRQGLGVLRPDDARADVVPGVHLLAGQGNSVAVETQRGVVLVDAGPGGRTTGAMIEWLRARTGKPITHIVYSHGHAGYNFGVQAWLSDARVRGHPEPQVVAQRGVRERYARYIETAGLQQWLNSRQFRAPLPIADASCFTMPDLEFDTHLTIDGGDRRIELIWAPSETDDTLAVWLPADRLLYGSAAVIHSMPNVGTPLRTMRDARRWAQTLERLHALRPAIVLGEFGGPVTSPADIDALLLLPAMGLRWLHQAVIDRMNQAKGIDDIVCELVDEGGLPSSIFGHRFMRPIYGAPEYVIRDIWRSENGWWDRNPTTLHPAAPSVVASDLRDAILGEPHDGPKAAAAADSLLDQARTLAAQGKTQLALHVIDLLVELPIDAPGSATARALKASLLDARAREVSPIVSRNLYRSASEELRGLPLGSTRQDDPTGDFSWN
jgi:alkyl sulfatase BDS1-like metallo-beta-lactamase superfamily hydrolase